MRLQLLSSPLRLLLVAAILLVALHCHCSLAFINRLPPGKRANGGGGGGSMVPPRGFSKGGNDWNFDGPEDSTIIPSGAFRFLEEEEENSFGSRKHNNTILITSPRGGSAKATVQGTKSTLNKAGDYWSNAFQSAGQSITKPFRLASEKTLSLFESKEKKTERELLQKLETTKIQRVVVPNTTVVPPEVIHLAARRSGMIGNPLRTDRVQDFAVSLKRWYQMRGYVLHSVTGATLKADSATAEIQVQEPKVSHQPVDITFCKEMVVDEETGNLLTFRQYKEKHDRKKTFGHKQITKEQTNTTFVQTNGKTRPERVAYALGLKPGKPFQWDPARWGLVAGSGIFRRVLQASPQRMTDGTVQLQILATEAPPRHLEYGVSKSLYTGAWEGEIDFQHDNLLGGGETLGLQIRRGTKDLEPSVRVRFSDDKFGLPGGYDVEAFSDFIGDQPETDGEANHQKAETDKTPHDPDALLDRRGARFTYRNPIHPRVIRYSTASASIERAATQSGIREAIGSGTLTLGPFRKQLPLDARSSMDGSMTTGVRIPERASAHGDGPSANYQGLTLLPYTSVTLTTTQLLPLLASSAPLGADQRNLPSLALRHSLTASTRNLPRHEQNAMGFASMVRGGTSNGRISTSLTGSTELRIPVQLDIPVLKKVQEDSSLVLFGDWVSARKNNGSPFFFKKSIGVGIRKVTQGIPLKVDFSYVGDGKIKSSFGLGRDFDV